MKYIINMIVLGVLGGIAYGVYWMEHGNTVPYQAKEIVEKVVEKEVVQSELQKRIADAQTASSTDIEQKAQKAYTEEKSRLLTEIELEVTRAYREEIEDREAKLEESVSSFVTARVN